MISPNGIILLTGVLIFLLFSFYLYLVFIKVKKLRYDKQKKQWIKRHYSEIQMYLLHGELEKVSFAPTKSYQYHALEDFFSLYLTNYKVDPEKDQIKKFVEHYFLDEYRRRLNHPKWSVRMNTLHFFDLFQLKNVKDDLLNHLKFKNLSPEEEHQIYILLASLKYENLYNLFKNSKEIPPFLLNVMLNRLVDEDNINQFIANFSEMRQSWQLGILDLIRNKNLRSWEIIYFLEILLASEKREMRIRALKTISHFGYLTSPEIILHWYEKNSERTDWGNDESAGERLMLARLMGMIKSEQFIPILEKLISDHKYNVRFEAAKAIRKYKNGKGLLKEIARQHSDKYSRNIAAEWVERGLEYE